MARTWERHITFGKATPSNGSGPRGLSGLTRLLLGCALRIAPRMGITSYTQAARNFAMSRAMMMWKAKKQLICQFCLAQTSPSVTLVLTRKHLRSALGNLIMRLG
jgi:hypothetical protein